MNSSLKTEDTSVFAGQNFRRLICGPVALLSIIVCTVCIIVEAVSLNPGLAEYTKTSYSDLDMAFGILLIISCSAQIPLNVILRRLRFSQNSEIISHSLRVIKGAYLISLIDLLGNLLYIIHESAVHGGNTVFTIINVVLTIFSLAVLICCRSIKPVTAAKQARSEEVPVQQEPLQAPVQTTKRAKTKDKSFFGTVKSVVFACFVLAAAIVAVVLIADKHDGKNYPVYSRDNMTQWLDESWQSHSEHNEKSYSCQITDNYTADDVLNDFNDYLYNTLYEDLRYCYDVNVCTPSVITESGHLTITADFEYNDYGADYENLYRFETKEEALRVLDKELRNGLKDLWFLVGSDWTLEDVDAVAYELSLNDVHTAAEWKSYLRSISDITDNGMKLASIEKVYDVDEEYLETCTKELNALVSIIAAEIKGKGYADNREMYKAVAEKVIALANYDDNTRINTLTDSLTDEEKVKRSAYGALVTGDTVCSGYAYAFKAICDELDLPCQVISGHNGDGGHVWNMTEGRLFTDCTFCDTSWSRTFMFMDQSQLDRYEYYLSSNQIYAIS